MYDKKTNYNKRRPRKMGKRKNNQPIPFCPKTNRQRTKQKVIQLPYKDKLVAQAYFKEYRKRNREKRCRQSRERYFRKREMLLQQTKEYNNLHKERIGKYKRQWYEKNKERLIPKAKEHYAKNKTKIRQQGKEHYLKNKERIAQQTKEYVSKNRTTVLQRKREYYKKNKVTLSKKNRERYYKNWQKIREKSKEYYQKNKNKVNEYVKRKLKNDPVFRLNFHLSNSIRGCLKKKNQNKTEIGWEKFLGYTAKELKLHLEKQFIYDSKLTWQNYGAYWHIDHIKPKSWFVKEETDYIVAIKKAWQLENLQPLAKTINLKKGDRNSFTIIQLLNKNYCPNLLNTVETKSFPANNKAITINPTIGTIK